MSHGDREKLEQRVLVLLLNAKDAELTQAILSRAGIACVCCADLVCICQELVRGAGAVLLAEEAVAPDQTGCLADWLARQPPWSDLPVLVLARPGADSTAVAQAMDLLGNVTVLERPTRVAALVSAVRAALRARNRQYEARAHLSQIEHSERDLSDFFENASVGLHWVGPDGMILRVNQTELEMLGYTREEYVGHHIAEFHANLPVIHDILDRLTSGETLRDFPARMRCKNGQIRDVLINSNVLWDNGRFVHTRCFTRDVTDQKRAEDELRKAQTQLQSELTDTKLLQGISAEIIHQDDFAALNEKFIDAAVAIMRSDFASMQMLYPERGAGGELRLLAFRGFNPLAAKFWEWVRADSESTCGEAFRTGRRAIAADVEKCDYMAGSQDLATYLDTGIHAVQSTPLISRSGELLGMISTHWKQPHQPSDRDLRLMDILARMAADLVERKRAQDALRDSEERFRLAQRVARVGTFEWNLQTGVNTWTPELEAIYGLKKGEFARTQMAWENLIHPDDRPAALAKVSEALDTGEPMEGEWRTTWRDGSLHWVAGRFQCLMDADGKPLRLAGVNIDITDRKQAEESIRRNQASLAELVERAPFGVYIVDSEFKISLVNKGSQDGAFINVRPVIGRDFSEAIRILWPADVAADIIANFRRTLDTGEPYFSNDYVQPRADIDSVESYEWELHRIKLPDGQYGVVCYYFDSTELRRAEQALREADRRKDEFLATLAHELRNPLAPIRNSLHILRMSNQHDPAAERVGEMIERQVNHMVRLVDDLLEVSRITRGKIDLRNETVEVAAIVHGAVETSRPLIEAAGHQLAISIPPDPLIVDGDPVRLTQVVANLLNNAAKYTAPGGQIWLSVRCEPGMVAISVRDTGEGIAPEMLPRVFDLFTQIDRNADRSQGGLGIGLTLVKSLVEMHGGSVQATSDGVGQGSEFVIRLPLTGAPPSTDVAPHDTHPAAAVTTRRVLVVDDNRDAAESLGMLLTLLGVDVRVVCSGAEALHALATYQPSVVLLDIGMPGMDGYEVARRIRQDPAFRGLTLIALTGWGQAEDRRRTHDAGFDHHLIKPAELSTLQSLLTSLEARAEVS